MLPDFQHKNNSHHKKRFTSYTNKIIYSTQLNIGSESFLETRRYKTLEGQTKLTHDTYVYFGVFSCISNIF